MDYEKLGVFYLGHKYDLDKGRSSDLVLYDSRDLVTHGVIIGMTGSGKTGLGISILEEAAMDGIPFIAVDPKGDLSNLLLTFPNLAASDFKPWVNVDDARRAQMTVDAFSEAEADRWRQGLAASDQDGGRIARLKENCSFKVYTPGSGAGLSVSILACLERPSASELEEADLLRERVSSTATCILALLGLEGDPLRSREHILLASIIQTVWLSGRDLTLPDLIALIQKPPMERIGALDVESFYPAKDRFELSMSINNLLASPGFEAWLKGAPLDIDRCLWGEDGKPQGAIFSISHLSDSERMFFVTILLQQVISWMRRQSGTSSLRAMLYMDEIFGYFPPVANPPSKAPLLTLLKQARAFGLGLVLASQNPVDIDYKGLANAGTWFIGRLQTERDKARLLDGLENSSSEAGASFDRKSVGEMLGRLGKRVFLMNNVHDQPLLFESRFTMSYLRGPLNRQQIKDLMQPVKVAEVVNNSSGADAVSLGAPSQSQAPSPSTQAASTVVAPQPISPLGAMSTAVSATPSSSSPSSSSCSQPPVIAPEIKQFFIPPAVASFGEKDHIYQPLLLASAQIRYTDTKLSLDHTVERSFLVPPVKGVLPIDFSRAKSIKITVDELGAGPVSDKNMKFADPPAALTAAAAYKGYTKDFQTFLAACTLKLAVCKVTGEVGRPGESERDFRIRINQVAQEKRDAALAQLRSKYASGLSSLSERIRNAEAKLAGEEAQARQQQIDSAISIGATVFGALMSRRPLGSTSVGRAASAARSVGRASKQQEDVGRAADNLASLEERFAEMNRQFEEEARAISSRYAASELSTIEVAPKKTNINVRFVGLAWVVS